MATGCGDDGSDGEIVVKITGDNALMIGETTALSASTINGQDSSYVWSSSDEAVVTVDDSGTVTGVSAGEAVITAVGADTEVSDTHGIVVLSADGGVVTPDGGSGDVVVVVDVGMHELPIGETTTATATTVNLGDEAYTWASSNPDVATVEADGTVTGVATGETVISATGMESGATGQAGIVVVNDMTIPNLDKWMSSAHADREAEAFTHWSSEDDGFEISTTCAKCHSGTGFQDFIGADGSAAGSVESPVDVSGGPDVIDCQACHNAAAQMLTTVEFPSGAVIDGLGSEARCMTCHQGRSSTPDLNEVIGTAGPDEVLTDASFQNIHYKQAGATLYGTLAKGGYQYDGQSYDGRFQHFTGTDTCVDCHDPHSLEVRFDTCANCHSGVATAEDARDIRMIVSQSTDYDGDGDLTEGIYYELETLRDTLLTEIQAYATATSGTDDICYGEGSYPYWFTDTDGDGSCSDTEAAYSNQYSTWTPRLLRATYNYQFEHTDPGDYAHNAKYVIQLLQDSIADLGGDVSTYTREDPGHFNGAAEAFRHWDEDPGFVEPDCSRCHGGLPGFEFELTHGVGTAVELDEVNGLQCQVCHTPEVDFTTDTSVRLIEFMEFPGSQLVRAQTLADADPDNTYPTYDDQGILCGQCHSGRNSRATVQSYIDSTAEADLSFRAINVHYLPAAATLFGNVVEAGYEYAGNTYAGQWSHTGGNVCTDCHQPAESSHSFAPDVTQCSMCHSGVGAFDEIRLGSTDDFDGDGDTSEGLALELETLQTALLAELDAAAVAAGGPDLCYESHSYPYFFVDTDGSGTTCDETEANFGNQYSDWTPALIQAAHNYQLSRKDPGAYVHNFPYIAQLLYDSIEDLGGDVTGYTRP